MKDIKSYVIGFLTCACMFLIMGQTKNENQYGRYQGFADEKANWMIDTSNGVIYKYYKNPNEFSKSYWMQRIEPNRIEKEIGGINIKD